MDNLKVEILTKVYLFESGFSDFIGSLSLWLDLIKNKDLPQISENDFETNVEKFYYFLNY